MSALSDAVPETVYKPLFLFIYCHVAVVKLYGIVSLAQWRNLAVGVNIVALLNVFKYVVTLLRKKQRKISP